MLNQQLTVAVAPIVPPRPPRQTRVMPTAAQLRAARAMLAWSMEDLATRSGVSSRTIMRAEQDGQPVSVRTLRRLVATYHAAGIEFIGSNDRGSGVRFRNRQR